MKKEMKQQLDDVRADIRALELQLKAIEAERRARYFATPWQRLRARMAMKKAIKARQHRIDALRGKIDLLEESLKRD